MRKLVVALAVGAGLLAAAPASAQVSLDLKAAYAIPSGNVWTTSPWNPKLAMSTVWSGAVPIEVTGRWRFTPGLSGGAYFGWGPAFLSSSTCTSGCGGWDMRFGLVLAYHFSPDRTLDPWFSIGTGWQWTQYSRPWGASGGTGHVTFNGWEPLNVAVGLDVVTSQAFSVGPYVGVVGGTYSNFNGTGTAVDYGGKVEPSGRSFHAWWQFGVKGTLNL